jgi:hypothetical protein
LLIYVYYNGKAFKGFFKCLVEYKLDIKAFILKLQGLFAANPEIRETLECFASETKKELFDEEEDLRSTYSHDENFMELIKGTAGANLLHKYLSHFYMEKSHLLFEPIIKAMSLMLPGDDVFQCKLTNILKFYRLSYEHFLSPNRKEILTKGYFDYNIADWLKSGESLDNFKNDKQREVVFYTPEEQFKIVEDYFKRYGRNEQAFGKILTKVWIVDMFRQPKEDTKTMAAV